MPRSRKSGYARDDKGKGGDNGQGLFPRPEQAAENSGPGRKEVPQGLKPDVFSIIYGTVENHLTKVSGHENKGSAGCTICT